MTSSIQSSRPPFSRSPVAFQQVASTYPQRRISEIAPIYLACFTRSADNDYLWTSEYGRQGKGCAIGFRVISESIETGDRYGIGHFPVIYRSDELLGRLTTQFSKIDATFLKHLRHYPNQALHNATVSSIFRVSAFAASAFKDERFSREAEWRLSCMLAKHEPLATGLNNEKHYFPVPVRGNQLPPVIDEIVVGSRADEREVAELKRFLSENGFSGVSVRPTAF